MNPSDAAKPVANTPMTKAQKKNAARKAKRAIEQNTQSDCPTGVKLAQDIAKVKITSEQPKVRPISAVSQLFN